MPTYSQLDCRVVWRHTDVKLAEHNTKYQDGVVETYISIPPEPTRFQVRLESHGTILWGLAMFVFIDGEYQCNRNSGPHFTDVELKASHKEIHMADGRFMRAPWKFHKIKTASHSGEASSNVPFDGECVGTIEVIVLRLASQGHHRIPSGLPPSSPTAQYSKFGLDGHYDGDDDEEKQHHEHHRKHPDREQRRRKGKADRRVPINYNFNFFVGPGGIGTGDLPTLGQNTPSRRLSYQSSDSDSSSSSSDQGKHSKPSKQHDRHGWTDEPKNKDRSQEKRKNKENQTMPGGWNSDNENVDVLRKGNTSPTRESPPAWGGGADQGDTAAKIWADPGNNQQDNHKSQGSVNGDNNDYDYDNYGNGDDNNQGDYNQKIDWDDQGQTEKGQADENKATGGSNWGGGNAQGGTGWSDDNQAEGSSDYKSENRGQGQSEWSNKDQAQSDEVRKDSPKGWGDPPAAEAQYGQQILANDENQRPQSLADSPNQSGGWGPSDQSGSGNDWNKKNQSPNTSKDKENQSTGWGSPKLDMTDKEKGKETAKEDPKPLSKFAHEQGRRPQPYWESWREAAREGRPAPLAVFDPNVEGEIYALHEDIIQKNKITHQVAVDKAKECFHPEFLKSCPKYLDDPDHPFAVFVFKFRDESTLSDMLGKDVRETPQQEHRRVMGLSKKEIAAYYMRKSGQQPPPSSPEPSTSPMPPGYIARAGPPQFSPEDMRHMDRSFSETSSRSYGGGTYPQSAHLPYSGYRYVPARGFGYLSSPTYSPTRNLALAAHNKSLNQEQRVRFSSSDSTSSPFGGGKEREKGRLP